MPAFDRRISCIIANVLLIAAIATFAVGFFPHKAFLPGLATWTDETIQTSSSAPFNRLIFMVVDALRSDFVYGNASSFKFTQGLIRSGAAIPFTGHASPPTITMPRVKAITTGSVPSFLDLVLNFAESDTSSTLASQDSWLAQMKAQPGSKLVMYGDDTWLRLFPGFFDRADGTTSFFVSDFSEVDNNVTRHIPRELEQDDWTVMVLHFLGLDHIGHKTGPKGPNMPAKQAEMDAIVENIYEAMGTLPHMQSSLLVLLGDHGMNDAGNHGASSAGEVSTALTFISPTFKNVLESRASPVHNVEDFRFYNEVEQSDVASTLAALLGFPVPKNNLGVMVPELLDLRVSDFERLQLLYQNAQQMHDVAAATFPVAFERHHDGHTCDHQYPNSDASSLACSWVQARQAFEDASSGKSGAQTSIPTIYKFLTQAQKVLSSTASNYGLSYMYVGIVLCFLAVLATGFAAMPQLSTFRATTAFFLLTIVLYAMTMFASSYVEEEHQFWYWFLSGWLAVLHISVMQRAQSKTQTQSLTIAFTASLFAVAKRWNQTGQKYVGNPDIVTEVMKRYPGSLWFLVVITYALPTRRLMTHTARWSTSTQMAMLPVLVGLSAFAFKVAFTTADAPELLVTLLQPVQRLISRFPLVSLARVVFLGIGHLFACALFYDRPWTSHRRRDRRQFLHAFHDLLTIFLITQTRTVNVPLFTIFSLQFPVLQKSSEDGEVALTLTSLLFQYSSFFILGGTNAISSIDLSNAYNGVAGYNVAAVGVLTFVGNWAGPIWWVSATVVVVATQEDDVVRTQKDRHRDRSLFRSSSYFILLTLFVSTGTFAVMLACTVLREHLFIWTVFSPKYLYTVAWVLAHHVLVNGLFRTVLLGGFH